ncbi:MAG: DivIVA domain-containing protein [Clostridiales bacterium]|nr:DivIVA domain-containing protein [Clostridiales bacterium]
MPGKFKTAKKGFDIKQVDEYIETVENVLRSYDEKSSAIESAIRSARQTADSIIKQAESEADRIKLDAALSLKEISDSVATQKKLAKEFQDAFNEFVSKYALTPKEADFKTINGKIDAFKSYMATVKLKRAVSPSKPN